MAFSLEGEKTWERIGVEPSGNAFNSLTQLEYENGKPRNPFINAGALVLSDILVSKLKEPKREYLNFIKKVANTTSIDYNEMMFESEKSVGFRNRALINFMKSFGNINNDIEEVLDFYFHTCAIEMTCEELAKAFIFLVNKGKLLKNKEEILDSSKTKRINAIMQTCGFYDEAGEFSFRVGLPGKSGVGGGIAAIHPNKYAVVTWSPRLNNKGNSYLGIEFLERLTTTLEMSIF